MKLVWVRPEIIIINKHYHNMIHVHVIMTLSLLNITLSLLFVCVGGQQIMMTEAEEVEKY